jgi:hypothetical protein
LTGYSIGNIGGLGTGVATALGTNVGTAGAPVVNGGALGTPSSGTLTNCTGFPGASNATIYLTGSNVAISSNPASPTSIINTGSIGAAGWVIKISASLPFSNTGAAVVCAAGLSNGSTIVAGGEATGPAANQGEVITLGPVNVTLSAATTFSLLAAANSGNTNALRAPVINTTFSPSMNDKMTSITWERIA